MKDGIQSRAKIQALKDSGCYFYSILKQVSFEHDITISDDAAEAFYHKAVVLGFMQANCFVENPVALANMVLVNAEKLATYRNIDRMKPDGTKLIIVRMERPMFAHFVVRYVDDTGKWRQWDSLDPKRPAASADWKDCSYRRIY